MKIKKNTPDSKKDNPRHDTQRPPSTIRVRLVAIIAASLIPSLFAAMWTSRRLSVAVMNLAHEEADRMADAISLQQKLLVLGAEQMLRTIAVSDAIRQKDIPALRRFLTVLQDNNSQYATIVATDAWGTVIASGASDETYSVADRPYMKEALRRRRLIVGPYWISRTTGLPIIPIVLPVLDEATGDPNFTLVAGLRVDVFSNILSTMNLPEGIICEILDREGNRILRYPNDPAFPPGESCDMNLIALSNRDSTFPSLYRGRRVFVRSLDINFDTAYVSTFRLVLAVSASIYTATNRNTLGNYVLGGAASFILSIILAAWLYTRNIGQRLKIIAEKAAAIGYQNGGPIRPPLDGEDEIDLLYRTLKDSADALQRRERERHDAAEAIESSLKEKEALLKEIHHRVKNNFQVISSLLSLQAMSIVDEHILRMFEESRNRIQSMALIHERLYHSETFSSIDFGEYAKSMVEQIATTYRDSSDRVVVDIHAGTAPLILDVAVPLGLILNELMSNSFKHAFPSGSKGKILIELGIEQQNRGRLAVSDDGTGLPENFAIHQMSSLGLELVETLTKQIHGTLNVESPPSNQERGTRFAISFPLPEGIVWTNPDIDMILKK